MFKRAEFLLLLGTAVLIAACSTATEKTSSNRLDWAALVGTDAIGSLKTNSINGWRAISDDGVVFTANAQRHFLVVLQNPIPDLIHADHVRLTTGNAGRLQSGFGKINARVNGQTITRFVDSIYPIGDQKALQILLQRLREPDLPKTRT